MNQVFDGTQISGIPVISYLIFNLNQINKIKRYREWIWACWKHLERWNGPDGVWCPEIWTDGPADTDQSWVHMIQEAITWCSDQRRRYVYVLFVHRSQPGLQCIPYCRIRQGGCRPSDTPYLIKIINESLCVWKVLCWRGRYTLHGHNLSFLNPYPDHLPQGRTG